MNDRVKKMELIFYQTLGILFLVLGLLFLVAPILLRNVPYLENVPWYILYVYRRDDFVFITSPILIIISVASLIINLITKHG